jgi:hypothetical protein
LEVCLPYLLVGQRSSGPGEQPLQTDANSQLTTLAVLQQGQHALSSLVIYSATLNNQCAVAAAAAAAAARR